MKKIIILCLLLSLFSCGLLEETNSSPDIADTPEELYNQMTYPEVIGQLNQMEWNTETPTTVKQHLLGSLLAGGGSSPTSNTPQAWLDQYNSLQAAAMSTRLGIPMLFGIDAVHGNNNVYGATIFPHNIGLGATRDAELVEEIAHITAIEVRAIGFHWNFAPCLAVAQDERWGRTYESYSENPQVVSELGAAAVRGYQGTSLSDKYSVLATIKHFVADGGTSGGTNEGNANMDEEILRSTHVFPYIAAIDAGAGALMPSFSSWNGEKMHGNDYLLTEVLKDELGFSGLIISDWTAHTQLPGTLHDQIRNAFVAGVDMFMTPYVFLGNEMDDLMNPNTSTSQAKIDEERIEEAVVNILTVKYDLNLFDNPYKDNSDLYLIGSTEHRAVAREAVRKSLVVLKNENGTLPLTTTQNILVAGSKADDLGSQCGGWTITWQGGTGDTTIGTTVLEAIHNKSSNVIYNATASNLTGIDRAAIVVGETPYAEGDGDTSNLDLTTRLTAQDKTAIKNLNASNVPYVVILFSGRAMIASDEIANSDAFIAAWLPGTEGDGIADILFGDYSPTGKLSFTWPDSMAQIPVNSTDDTYPSTEYLYPFGYGISY
ncbi:MAG: glycoside hydrolase family 3 C-terminal domain-containing protein [Spirochaetaceae bacterium]|jgi:beta-glucosidase|nr:glycoside hydrolase family 3 C-terminal domain-containing protein [Spirochaetaceae bacterium]